MNKDLDLGFYVNNINQQRSTVQIVVDKNDVAKIMQRRMGYQSLPYKLRPALERVGDYVRTEMIPEVFEQEGPGWARLSRRTIVDRLNKGFGKGPILQRTRDLYNELVNRSHPRHIEVIKTGKFARIEIGGSSVKFIENQLGRTDRNLPARPMIPGTNGPISALHKREIANIFAQAIKDIL